MAVKSESGRKLSDKTVGKNPIGSSENSSRTFVANKIARAASDAAFDHNTGHHVSRRMRGTGNIMFQTAPFWNAATICIIHRHVTSRFGHRRLPDVQRTSRRTYYRVLNVGCCRRGRRSLVVWVVA